jgi:hypothetical protein
MGTKRLSDSWACESELFEVDVDSRLPSDRGFLRVSGLAGGGIDREFPDCLMKVSLCG